MTAPARIVLSRQKGWRLPEGAVIVGRPTRWGNPYAIQDYIGLDDPRRQYLNAAVLALGGPDASWCGQLLVSYAETAVAAFGLWLGDQPDLVDAAMAALAGRDLACWCPIERPDGTYAHCHADVWLTVCSDMSFEEVKAANLARVAS